MWSQMSSIVSQIEPEQLELFALEFGKIAEYDFVYTLSFTNINQSADRQRERERERERGICGR